jgi:hypothetical protein
LSAAEAGGDEMIRLSERGGVPDWDGFAGTDNSDAFAAAIAEVTGFDVDQCPPAVKTAVRMLTIGLHPIR